MDILRPLLPELGIATDQCAFPDAALRLLNSRKYEAIIVDDEILGGVEFMSSLRGLPMTRNAIIFAVIRYVGVKEAFQSGANFALEKPLTAERAQRSFHAALGLIMRERRRFFRYTVNVPASLEFSNRVENITVSNLSEGGMAIDTSFALTPGLIVKCRFDLPGLKFTIEAKGEVSWTDNQGHAGVCFQQVPHLHKEKLEEWLTTRGKDEPVAIHRNSAESWHSDEAS
ncbi:PilZ domain-containing protein [Candidatus Korobacter versatilis]|uniref:PilZ domain-containing protein n=1 Tax=Candidatus Korobacter versatilis TaxID=658062 RepID=UPI0003025EBF|nr:PilZ domain-containing protein [Candidatus Koribacter versatilis]